MTSERNLAQWLVHIEALHPSAIEMGLARVSEVARRLDLTRPAPRTIIVGGTNGKGSTVTLIEAVLLAAGKRVGATLSPHLLRFNERVHVNGAEAPDEMLCAAFSAIESARLQSPTISLTYFEYSMLAAFWCFRHAEVEIGVIEVGLGGRLDAANLVHADVAVVTSVDLDHQDYLGHDREVIGVEKVAIARAGGALVLGEHQPPNSVIEFAERERCRVWRRGLDFDVEARQDGFAFRFADVAQVYCAMPALAMDNVATALAAIHVLGEAPGQAAVIAGVQSARIDGRLQMFPGHPKFIVDVAHNPHGARFLARQLRALSQQGVTRCVIGALADKDARGVIDALRSEVRYWYCAGTDGARGRSAQALAKLVDMPEATVRGNGTLDAMLELAAAEAAPNDLVVVCGSFQTCAGALQWLRDGARKAVPAW